jgi:WD40 repeat protein
VAAFSTYRGDIDVVLFDARKRELIRSLTKGFTNDYQYLVAQELSLGRKMGRDLAFSPDGNTIAVFAKRERGRGLVLLDPLHGGVRRIIDMEDVEQQVGPAWSPDGTKVAFSGNRAGRFDIFELDVESGAVRNLTDDEAYDGSPVYTPDGKGLVYSSISGLYAKLFRLDLAAPGQRQQLTRGNANDKDAVFSLDGSRIYYSSDRDGIDNIFSLDPASGETKQLTDVVTGCFMPSVVLHPEGGERVVYTGYWDGRFDLYMIDTMTPAPDMVGQAETPPPAEAEAAPPDAQPTFEPDITVTIDEANKESYGGWKLFLEDAGATVGVNTDQTFVSDSYLLFSDYLGDRRLFVRFSSIESFSNFDISYFNLGQRLQWGARIFDDRTFYLGQDRSTGQLRRGRAAYTETGAMGLLAYPFDFYHRFEAGLGFISREIDFQSFIFDEDRNPIPIILPRKDEFPMLQASLIGDSTVFAEFGAISGRRWNISASYAPDLDKESALSGLDGPREPGSVLTAAVTLDARQYFRVSQRSSVAMRLFAGYSSGNAPQPFFFGGLDTLRGFDFRDFVGDRAFFANVEYRFPLFDNIRGPFLNFRGVRGRVFLDVGGAWLDYAGEEFDFWDEDESRLKDGASAYGWGFTLDMFGLDLNWDFAKRWDFKESVDEGFETAFWIGTQF